jgi:hypothetical protein
MLLFPRSAAPFREQRSRLPRVRFTAPTCVEIRDATVSTVRAYNGGLSIFSCHGRRFRQESARIDEKGSGKSLGPGLQSQLAVRAIAA